MGKINLDEINAEVSKVISIAEIDKSKDLIILVNTQGLTLEQAQIYSKKIDELVLDYKDKKSPKQSFLVIPVFGADFLRILPLEDNANYVMAVNAENMTPKQRKNYFSMLKNILTEFYKKLRANNKKNGFLVLPASNNTVKLSDIANLSDDELAKFGLKKL